MKRIFLSVIAIAIVHNSFAQWTASGTNLYNSNTGNVGIGTTSPAVKLDILGKLRVYNQLGTNDYTNVAQHNAQVRIVNGLGTFGTKALEIGLLDNGTGIIQANESNVGYNTLALNPVAGNVGIGTTSPSGKLQVKLSAYDFLTSPYTIDVGTGSNSGPWARAFRVVGTSGSNGRDGGAFGVLGTGGTPAYIYMAIPTSDETGYDSPKILILNNAGNVGIGTTTPDSKLAVAGTIHAKEVKVNLTGWPDYVFKPSYSLRSLSEVKSYIDQNGHLPEMPSADDVHANGLNLGEINRLLTKKVEELTLYLIEKDKQDKEKDAKLQSQQKQNEQQETRIANLEKALARLTGSN